MTEISKKTLEHLAELARLELNKNEEERFLKDLQKILGHFSELQSLNAENVPPMTGGTALKNVFREDENRPSNFIDAGKIAKQFPDYASGYLKVPPIFE